MRVLANDGLEDEGAKLFDKAGIELDREKKDDLIARISDYDGLIVRSATKVTAEVIEAGRNRLKVIGRAGVGYDNVDVKSASDNGIVVKYAPNGNTNATAELAFSLMMAVSRNIPQAHYSLKQGIWQKKKFKGVELSGKTLGIIGCGRIGTRLSQLSSGFDMKLLGYDISPVANGRIEFVGMDELLERSDYVSIHTGGKSIVIGEEQISKMKPSAYLINASRGSNVDEAALYSALKEGRLAGAGLDSYANEPKKEGAEFGSAVRGLDNVVLSSHLGASTREAQRDTGIEMAEVVIGYLVEGDWHNAVNVQEEVKAEGRDVYSIFVTHEDVPGMFARIDSYLASKGVNIRENRSRRLNGAVSTVYMIHDEPDPSILDGLRSVEGVRLVKD